MRDAHSTGMMCTLRWRRQSRQALHSSTTPRSQLLGVFAEFEREVIVCARRMHLILASISLIKYADSGAAHERAHEPLSEYVDEVNGTVQVPA